MNEKIKTSIELLPHKSGVYQMFDKDNNVIYVGKAKDLYKRVSQYFLRPQTGKVLAMVNNVDHFEINLTKNEKEALLLEYNLIQQYFPRYNILLKDNKHYPYIALKKKGDPFLKIARNRKDKNYDYFGPFPSSRYAYEVIDLLNHVFPLRKCKNIPASPCLYFHLGECLAPCINDIDEATFLQINQQIHAFLEGNNKEIYQDYRRKMTEASENLDFEKAKEYKEILDAIDHINMSQNIDNNDRTARDIYGYVSREKYLSLSLLTYRNGLLLGKKNFVVERFGDIKEQIIDLISQYYQDHELPREIIINLDGVKESLEEFYEVNVNSVTKGKLYDSVSLAQMNALQGLEEYFARPIENEDKIALLDELGQILSIPTPYRIELFDNSHIHGDSLIGAMVCFTNGEPNKKMYRKFHIESNHDGDDYASMHEIIKRRYSRLKENNESMPNLILVDGGDKQIRVALKALEEIQVSISVFGLYKNDKHQTKGLIDKDGNTYDVKNQNLFFLLVRMQDEVHRYAITFHHEVRSKSYKVSLFDGIKGLGRKRVALLEETYPSLDKLKSASLEEFEQILPKDVARELFNKLKELN